MYPITDPVPMPVIYLLLLGVAFSLLTIGADMLFEKRRANRLDARKREHRRYLMQSHNGATLIFRYSPDNVKVYTYVVRGKGPDRELELIDVYSLS